MPTSSSAVDPAILEALGLDAETTRISSHGGSGFASTFRLSSVKKSDGGGQEVSYFVKTGTGAEADVMFTGELLFCGAFLRLFFLGHSAGGPMLGGSLSVLVVSRLSEPLQHTNSGFCTSLLKKGSSEGFNRKKRKNKNKNKNKENYV